MEYYSAPPLVCTTLSVKTAVNPKSHQHEIVAVAALTHRGVAVDGAAVWRAVLRLLGPCVPELAPPALAAAAALVPRRAGAQSPGCERSPRGGAERRPARQLRVARV